MVAFGFDLHLFRKRLQRALIFKSTRFIVLIVSRTNGSFAVYVLTDFVFPCA